MSKVFISLTLIVLLIATCSGPATTSTSTSTSTTNISTTQIITGAQTTSVTNTTSVATPVTVPHGVFGVGAITIVFLGAVDGYSGYATLKLLMRLFS